MKSIYLSFAAAVAATAVLAAGNDPVTETRAISAKDGARIIDGIAAKVNDEVITISEVMNELRRNPESRVLGSQIDRTTLREVYRGVVNSLVDRKLIIKASKEAKMDLQDWVVDNRIREIIHANFEGDINKLKEALQIDNIPFEEWKRTIQEDLIVAAMRWQTIGRNLHASPGAMRAEYACHPERYTLPSQLDISVILLKPSADDAISVAERGAKIIERINGGEDFAEIARNESSDPHAAEGGKWLDVKPETMFQPEVIEALNKLNVGEMSGLIEMNGWGFIVRKDSQKESQRRSFEEAYASIEENIKLEQGKAAYERWMKTLREDALVIIYELPGIK